MTVLEVILAIENSLCSSPTKI